MLLRLCKGWCALALAGAAVLADVPDGETWAGVPARVLEPAGITVQVRGSRFDDFQPSRWWSDRGSIRWILMELPKLVAYRLGLGE